MPWINVNPETHLCPIPALNRESVGDEWACPDCGCIWRVQRADVSTSPRFTDPKIKLVRTNDRQLSL